MKRIWFTQQKPFAYNPLRWGLGYICEREVRTYEGLHLGPEISLCPKIFTTRTHPLHGEYYVVEGSRFKAKAVEPSIKFRVDISCLLNLAEGLVCPIHDGKPDYDSWACLEILDRNNLHFAELDLGIKKATFKQLRDELLRLNKKASLGTVFYINRLEAYSERGI